MNRTEPTRLFKALSDGTRLRIIGLLIEGELCVCDLVAVLDMPQSTVSRHLAYLKNSGLVKDSRHGVWMHYRLAAGDDSLHRELLAMLRRELNRLPEVRRDQKLLRKYISRKQAAAC